MSTLKKNLKKKIPAQVFFPVLIIFAITVSIILANIFYSKPNSEQLSASPKTEEQVSKQETNKQSANKSSSESAKQIASQVFKPALSGNQIKIPILYYHYVGNNPNAADLQRNALSITPDKFEEQMKYLKDNGYVTTSFDTLYAALKKQTTVPDKSIILTFDDGYIDFYYNAYNILRKYGFSATVFVPTELVGQPAYLTWPMISEMNSSGLIHFGAHSVHHLYLTSISPDAAMQELQESKKDLQDHLGIPINFMAYPYGDTNSSVVNLVQKAGYIGAIGTWSSKLQSEGTIYNSPRLRISGSIDISSFATLVQ